MAFNIGDIPLATKLDPLTFFRGSAPVPVRTTRNHQPNNNITLFKGTYSN